MSNHNAIPINDQIHLVVEEIAKIEPLVQHNIDTLSTMPNVQREYNINRIYDMAKSIFTKLDNQLTQLQQVTNDQLYQYQYYYDMHEPYI